MFFLYDVLGKPLVDLVATALSIGECSGTWSAWDDRDNPGGSGDWETLTSRHDANQLCKQPIAVEARIVGSGGTVTTQNVQLTLLGLICQNKNQPFGENCLDYEVRLCCAKSGNIIGKTKIS